MLTGTVGSLVVNLGWMFLVHADQRVLLSLFASVLLGMGLLLTETKGALGMGILFGAGASIAVGLSLVAIDGSIVPKS